MKKNGFTLIELLVVIAITAILSAIVLFTVKDYINKGKDASVKGNLAVLVTDGEAWYDRNNNSYDEFCGSQAVRNAIISVPSTVNCKVNDEGNAWAACAQEFSDGEKAYCVDSTGTKTDIDNSACTEDITVCPEE